MVVVIVIIAGLALFLLFAFRAAGFAVFQLFQTLFQLAQLALQAMHLFRRVLASGLAAGTMAHFIVIVTARAEMSVGAVFFRAGPMDKTSV